MKFYKILILINNCKIMNNSGHKHLIIHQWYKGVPIISGKWNAEYTNIYYFFFDKKTKTFLKDETIIEGPIPICNYVYEPYKTCHLNNTFDY